MEPENSRLKVRLKGNLYIYKCFIGVLYIFDSSFQEEFGNAPDLKTDNFSVNFCHVLSRFYLLKRIHDPVTARWIAFNGKLMSFRIEIFKKQFVCGYCFLLAGILTCVSAFFLLTRITSSKMPANFIQFLLSSSATSEFYLKICY